MLEIKDLAMMHHTNRLRAGVAVVVGLLMTGVGARAQVIEQILVKVNGEIFTKTDLEERQVQALRSMGQQGDINDAQLRQKLDEVTPQLIVNVVDEMLLVQRGRDLGYRMGDEQFKSVLESIKKDNKID